MRVGHSLRSKILTIAYLTTIPLVLMIAYLIISLTNYSKAYDEIVSNLTVANSYDLDFKNKIDESMYKLAVGSVTFENIDSTPDLDNPYTLLDDFENDTNALARFAKDYKTKRWHSVLMRNIKSLRSRMEDIEDNIKNGGSYNENMLILDNDIYVLTELIQDDLQTYIYYQTKEIEGIKNALDTKVRSFVFYSVIMLLAIIALVLIVTTDMTKSITKPVNDLCKALEKVASGDFAVRSEVKSHDEIGVLSDSFNSMTEEIEQMVSTIKHSERMMRDAEIRLLQEQINPHFLYNALDTIVWLIECGETEKAENMVMSLSSFFRMVLSKGRDYISIRDEELHVKSYLEIQQIRYADILDYEININPEIYDFKIHKLTLQPIIENALYHGIKYKREGGKIEVTGYLKGNDVHLKVTDNGIGMDEEGLNELRDRISKPAKEGGKGYGLANVNERIRMSFGEEYGMTVDSEKGVGTSIELVIPAIKYENRKS